MALQVRYMFLNFQPRISANPSVNRTTESETLISMSKIPGS